jgi:PST family polysaccharide transporter
MAFAGAGYWALVWAALVQTMLESVSYSILKPHPKRPMLDQKSLKDLLSYGVGASMGRLGNYLALKGDYVVAGRLLGTGPLGIYSRAYGLMSLPVGIYQNIASKALFSAVSKVQHDLPRLAVAHRRVAAATGLLLLPTGIMLSLLAPELVEVVLGPKWDNVVLPFQFMALGLFFRSGYNVGAAVAKGAGDVHRLAVRQWIYPGLVVLAAWLGASRGVTGIAAAVVLAIIVHFMMVTQLSLRCSNLSARDFLQAHLPAVTLGATLGGVVWLMRELLRGMEFQAVPVILGCLGTAALTAYLLMRFLPGLVLGRDGIWFLNRLGDLTPKWMPNMMRLYVPTSR